MQVSVLHSEDPAAHLTMGRALSALRDTNVAVVGSGFASFHNLAAMQRLMFAGGRTGALRARSERWNELLTAAVGEEDRAKREAVLARWREMPHAYEMHPPHGAEHFLPLLVAAGSAAAEDGRAKAFKDELFGLNVWTYYWGDVAV